MLSSLAEMETRLAALQTRIHCSSGTRFALQTVLIALQLCLVALQLFFLCPSALCSYPLPLTSGMRSVGLQNNLKYGYSLSKRGIVATATRSKLSTQTSRRHCS